MYLDLAHQVSLGEATKIVPRNEERGKQTQLNRAPIDEGVHDFVHQFREFVIAIWLSPGRQGLALLTIGTILVICATAAA